MSSVLEVADLEKSLGDFRLGPINLNLESGMALGFIGSNGAGKSTTIHCLLGLTRPSRGEIRVCGALADPELGDWKQNIGFILSEHGFYERMSGEENLNFLSSFYHNWDPSYCDELAARLQLDLRKKVKTLSSGDRMKLALIGALSHRPRLLILDEPTSGLDPVVRAEVLELIADLLRSGEHALFMSTHIFSDVSMLADDLAFIRAGRFLGVETKEALLERWRRISFRATEKILDLPGIVEYETKGSLHLITTDDATQAMLAIQRANAEILESNRLTLEEISVQILKGASR